MEFATERLAAPEDLSGFLRTHDLSHRVSADGDTLVVKSEVSGVESPLFVRWAADINLVQVQQTIPFRVVPEVSERVAVLLNEMNRRVVIGHFAFDDDGLLWFGASALLDLDGTIAVRNVQELVAASWSLAAGLVSRLEAEFPRDEGTQAMGDERPWWSVEDDEEE